MTLGCYLLSFKVFDYLLSHNAFWFVFQHPVAISGICLNDVLDFFAKVFATNETSFFVYCSSQAGIRRSELNLLPRFFFVSAVWSVVVESAHLLLFKDSVSHTTTE